MLPFNPHKFLCVISHDKLMCITIQPWKVSVRVYLTMTSFSASSFNHDKLFCAIIQSSQAIVPYYPTMTSFYASTSNQCKLLFVIIQPWQAIVRHHITITWCCELPSYYNKVCAIILLLASYLSPYSFLF